MEGDETGMRYRRMRGHYYPLAEKGVWWESPRSRGKKKNGKEEKIKGIGWCHLRSILMFSIGLRLGELGVDHERVLWRRAWQGCFSFF